MVLIYPIICKKLITVCSKILINIEDLSEKSKSLREIVNF